MRVGGVGGSVLNVPDNTRTGFLRKRRIAM
jgi:hypothetical protein